MTRETGKQKREKRWDALFVSARNGGVADLNELMKLMLETPRDEWPKHPILENEPEGEAVDPSHEVEG